jgi:hypothetical protein
MKAWYKSRTLWFNVLVAMGTAIEASLSLVEGYFDPRVFLAIIGLVSGVNVILRFMTTTEIVKK